MRIDVFLGIDARLGRLLFSTVGSVDDYEDMNQAHSSKSEQGLAPYYYLWAYSNDTQNEPDGWIRPFSIVDTQQWHG